MTQRDLKAGEGPSGAQLGQRLNGAMLASKTHHSPQHTVCLFRNIITDHGEIIN